jgi:hypothetical protein
MNPDDYGRRVSLRGGHSDMHVVCVPTAAVDDIRGTRRRSLAFLLFVSNASRLRLHFAHLAKVKTYRPSSKRIRLRLPAVLLERSP